MTSTASSRLRTPEEIALNAGAQFTRLLPPAADVFAARALRLRELAAGHAMRDYLMLMALVCEAQHQRLAHYPAIPLPSEADADAASQAGQPLLNIASWPRAAVWRDETRALLDQVLGHLPADSPARPAVQALRSWSDEQLEQQAERLLSGITLGLDLAAAPFLAAGLQLYWTHLVRSTAAAQRQPFGITQEVGHCPCCGSLPTASVTRVGGQAEGQRFLHCALCNAEWHMVRVKCTHCQSTGGIHYQSLRAMDAATPAEGQPAREAIQAETCDSCGHYLKIVHMDQNLHVDPIADDLASLTLDLLVSEAGFTRHGVNFMLLFGDGGDAPAQGGG